MAATTREQTRTPSLPEVIRAALDTRLQGLHVALPGRVESYDATLQKANVKPMIKRRVATSDGTELLEPLPVITDVPVVFPRAGSFFVSLPLHAGDFVLLVFCERSIDTFYGGSPGQDADPDDFRTHDLTDAVAIPGFYPKQSALSGADPDKLVVGVDGGAKIKIASDGTTTIDPAGGLVHVGAESAAGFATRDDLFTTVKGLIETWAAGVKNTFDNHTHVETGGTTEKVPSPGGQLVALPPLPATAANKVKVT